MPSLGRIIKACGRNKHLVQTIPKAELLSPDHHDMVYPWGLRLEWNRVKGAVKYIVEVTRSPTSQPLPEWAEPGDEAFDKEVTITEAELDEEFATDDDMPPNVPTTIAETIDLPGSKAGALEYVWQVRVFGPPPYDEEGSPSTAFQFSLNGETVVAERRPCFAYQCNHDITCHPYNTPINFTGRALN